MNVVWFRRDLRVEDNTALIEACQSGEPVVGVYIATPKTWERHSLSPIQADLIYRRLFALQDDLQKLNIPLYYAEVDSYKDCVELISDVMTSSSASGLFFNKQYEFDEVQRDSVIVQLLKESNIECSAHEDKCFLPPGSVLNKQGGYFKVFTPFKRAYLQQMEVKPLNVIKAQKQSSKLSSLDNTRLRLFSQDSPFSYPRISSNNYKVETTEVIQALRDFEEKKVELYAENRDYPAVDATSILSPYLAVGILSIRQCMARVMYQQQLPLSGGREVWQSELIWREFYQHLAYFEPKLSKGESFNPWGEHLRWENSQVFLEAWKSGKTGYPIVDAAMKQLNETGWMHNRLRMIVASFLIKDLHIDWRVGEQYFMSKLVDGDYPANNGGWQWCSSTGCDGQPYFRIFNPITQGERFDPDGRFIIRWLPQLAEVPKKFLHQPWKWPRASQLKYPTPIVDHKVQRGITLDMYKQAKEYSQDA